MQTNTSKPCVTSETIKYVFAKLFARYGSKWSSQYPTDLLPAVQKEWLEELQGLEGADLHRGFENWDEDWPPNAIEFRKACQKQEEKLPPYYREYEYQALPAPVNRKYGRECLKKIKAMLNR